MEPESQAKRENIIEREVQVSHLEEEIRVMRKEKEQRTPSIHR